MDKHDEEFEMYLRQFKLREISASPEFTMTAERPSVRRTRKWTILAAAGLAAVLICGALIRHFVEPRGPYATVEAPGYAAYTVGARIEARRAIRSSSVDSIVLRLDDGSRLELRAQSELSLEPVVDGVRVRLTGGSVIVSAAEPGAGRLYVQTREALASAIGAVFVVSAESSGSRVGVISGEVRVEQGAGLTELMGGEQFRTNPLMALPPLAEAIAWSRNANAHMALLLPQAISPAPPAISPPLYERPLPEPVPVTAPQQPAAPPPPQPQQPAAPELSGQQIFDRVCTACHNAEAARSKHFETRDEYADLVSRQIAMGAMLSQKEFPVLVDYLFGTLGKKPVPPADAGPPKKL